MEISPRAFFSQEDAIRIRAEIAQRSNHDFIDLKNRNLLGTEELHKLFNSNYENIEDDISEYANIKLFLQRLDELIQNRQPIQKYLLEDFKNEYIDNLHFEITQVEVDENTSANNGDDTNEFNITYRYKIKPSKLSDQAKKEMYYRFLNYLNELCKLVDITNEPNTQHIQTKQIQSWNIAAATSTGLHTNGINGDTLLPLDEAKSPIIAALADGVTHGPLPVPSQYKELKVEDENKQAYLMLKERLAQKASQALITGLKEFQQSFKNTPKRSQEEISTEIARYCNNALVRELSTLNKTGTFPLGLSLASTLVLVLDLGGDEIYICNAGDSDFFVFNEQNVLIAEGKDLSTQKAFCTFNKANSSTVFYYDVHFDVTQIKKDQISKIVICSDGVFGNRPDGNSDKIFNELQQANAFASPRAFIRNSFKQSMKITEIPDDKTMVVIEKTPPNS
jgi:serine/threonine protein phosphatase PrpC